MDLVTSLAVGLGLLKAVIQIFPSYYGGGTSGVLPALLTSYSDLDRTQDLFNGAGGWTNVKQEYDFIIVGGGSAGSVVANRLSESFKVLLLEAGGEPNPLQSVPFIGSGGYKETDYLYRTIPQKNSCLSLINQQSVWNRGKGLGGTSNINGMVHLRGHPQDYANWANLTGDSRWSYEELLPYFLKSEKYCSGCNENASGSAVNPSNHRQDGELAITKPVASFIAKQFLDALEWAGLPRVDFNAPYTEGAAEITLNIKDGRRFSSFQAFIETARNRSNLTIHKFSRAYKIIFGDNNTASGIEYERHGLKAKAFATKEVILSAGTIDSPKLLMLSGIGPKQHLESLGIPVRVDAPVGQNLQDHLTVIPGSITVDSQFPDFTEITQNTVDEYLHNGTGPIGAARIHAVAQFASSRAIKEGQKHWPDIQLLLLQTRETEDGYKRDVGKLALNETLIRQFYAPNVGKDGFLVLVLLSRPKATGEILLKSANYKDDTLINPRYLEDEEDTDIEVVVEALKRVVNISENAPSLKALGSKLSRSPFPSCADKVFQSDEYWKCLIRHWTFTTHHFTGTASMGKIESPKAVVDSELRVIGIKNLRVIDASIMPAVTTVNTHAPAILVGERGAQFVKDAWK